MKPHHYVLDDENRPVVEPDLLTWCKFFEALERRTVGWSQITSEVEVSTVFLGIDHRFIGDGPPILFETMIFGGPEEIDERQWRYSSWDDAEAGHKAAVRKAHAACGHKITVMP